MCFQSAQILRNYKEFKGTMFRFQLRRRVSTRNLSQKETLDSVLTRLRGLSISKTNAIFLKKFLDDSLKNKYFLGARYVWYKYVMRSNSIVFTEQELCQLGGLSIENNNSFIPYQICKYYYKFYSKRKYRNIACEYIIKKNKVEAFAMGTFSKTQFREKWKVFVMDLDNKLPVNVVFNVHDFPFLTKSLAYQESREKVIHNIVFSQDKKYQVRNKSSLVLILNMVLLQEDIPIPKKFEFFEEIEKNYKTLDFSSSREILSKQLDPYSGWFKRLNPSG